jgi:hypothetical protein
MREEAMSFGEKIGDEWAVFLFGRTGMKKLKNRGGWVEES